MCRHVTGQVDVKLQLLNGDGKRRIDDEHRRDERVVFLKLDILRFETLTA